MPEPITTASADRRRYAAGRFFVVAGAVLAAFAVAAGAFGAHALEGALTPGRLGTYQTAARYQMTHALGLLLVGLLAGRPGMDRRLLAWAGPLIFGGSLIFSGSLYALVLLDLPVLGAVAPLGGVGMIGGWLALAACAWRGAKPAP